MTHPTYRELDAALDHLCKTAKRVKQERDELLAALKGLWTRHNDGSEEAQWAEWDTAQDAIARAEEVA